jgi:hypothetical protein
MTDIHGLAGRTPSAGEAELRKKLWELSKMLRLSDHPHARNAGQLIDDVLTGRCDPLAGEARL